MNLLNNASQLNKEERIFKLLQLLKKSPALQEVLKSMDVVPRTIYTYLKTIQRAQFGEPEYIKFLDKAQGADEFQQKEIDSWKQDAQKKHTDTTYDQYRVTPNEKFYDDLHYFLLCFKFISRK